MWYRLTTTTKKLRFFSYDEMSVQLDVLNVRERTCAPLRINAGIRASLQTSQYSPHSPSVPSISYMAFFGILTAAQTSPPPPTGIGYVWHYILSSWRLSG
jgi:hypothetical protein